MRVSRGLTSSDMSNLGVVFVLGGGGLLGSSLVPMLRKYSERVTVFKRQDVETETSSQFGSPRFHEHLFNQLNSQNPAVIINLAALTDVGRCQAEPSSAYIVNTWLPEIISSWIKDNGTTKFIQLSTDHNYDGPQPATEEQIKISNFYGFSKYAGELAALSVGATVVRTNFFGRSQCDGRLSFSDWVYNSLVSGAEIRAFNNVFFSPLSLETLCTKLLMISADPRGGVFNLGSKNGMSKADFIYRLAERLQLDTSGVTRVEYSSLDAIPRPRDMRMNSDKFERIYGGAPLPTLLDEINQASGGYV